MNKAITPWRSPAGGAADGGGVKRDWRWAKPEKPGGAKSRGCGAGRGALCRPDCDLANHWKRWDGKATGLKSCVANR